MAALSAGSEYLHGQGEGREASEMGDEMNWGLRVDREHVSRLPQSLFLLFFFEGTHLGKMVLEPEVSLTRLPEVAVWILVASHTPFVPA
jgi:hypothetical protein